LHSAGAHRGEISLGIHASTVTAEAKLRERQYFINDNIGGLDRIRTGDLLRDREAC
jgi:hypothetical protein